MSHTIVALLTTIAWIPASTADKLPGSLDLTAIRELVVQHDGRWPPLDTMARCTVESVTDDAFVDGNDPVLMLLGWTFSPRTWQGEPLIPIRNAELRRELQLPPDKVVFSYTDLAGHRPLLDLIAALSHMDRDRGMNALESKVSDISSKLILLQEVFKGNVIRPIPDPENITGRWTPIASSTAGELAAVVDAWDALEDAFVSNNAAAFTKASEDLKAALAVLPAATRPTPKRIATELRYNRLNPFRSGWVALLIGTALAAVGLLVRKRWFDVIWIIAIAVGFGIVTYGLSLRWQIAGRIPASNMYESLLFLSWGAGLFAIVAAAVLHHRLVVLTASMMAAVSLMLADLLPLDHYIRPIVPVLLDTVWMSIHVPVIMVSYAVLALGAVVAHAQLVIMAAAPKRRDLHDVVDAAHYWTIHIGSILLLAGVVTGSMWAASSWGRYWGWDPKEVWSLVALLGYLAILHVRIRGEKVRTWAYAIGAILAVALFVLVVPKLQPLTSVTVLALAGTVAAMVILAVVRGKFAMALKSVLCFWLIIMTYLGVNYVLGTGLHTYGFGTGAVARHMLLVGGIDLGLILLCCLFYLARRPSKTSTASSAPATASA